MNGTTKYWNKLCDRSSCDFILKCGNQNQRSNNIKFVSLSFSSTLFIHRIFWPFSWTIINYTFIANSLITNKKKTIVNNASYHNTMVRIIFFIYSNIWFSVFNKDFKDNASFDASLLLLLVDRVCVFNSIFYIRIYSIGCLVSRNPHTHVDCLSPLHMNLISTYVESLCDGFDNVFIYRIICFAH